MTNVHTGHNISTDYTNDMYTKVNLQNKEGSLDNKEEVLKVTSFELGLE